MWGFLNKGYVRGTTAMKCLPMHYFIGKWTQDRFEFEGKEMKDAVNLVTAIFTHPGFGIDVVPKFFGFRAYSNKPVSLFLEQIEAVVPVMHVFGGKDWMDKYAFRLFVKDRRLASRIEIIEEATHQIPNFKSDELTTLVTSFIASQQKTILK